MRSIIACAIATCAVSGTALADTVNLQYTGLGSNRSIQITIGSSTFGVHAGQLMHAFSAGTGVAAQFNGQTKATFCTDLTETVSGGGSTYTVAPIASLPQTAGWPAMGATRAQGVYNLFAAAAGAQFAGGADADYAAAFQIALWEVVYDYTGSASSLNLGSGNFRANQSNGSSFTGAILTDVNAFFTALTTGPNAPQTGLLGLTNNGCQDQIAQISALPLPSGAWAGLGGLVLAAAARRGMRRR